MDNTNTEYLMQIKYSEWKLRHEMLDEYMSYLHRLDIEIDLVSQKINMADHILIITVAKMDQSLGDDN